MKFPEFVQYKTAILMFHLFQGTLPIHLQNIFTIYSTTRSTRCITERGIYIYIEREREREREREINCIGGKDILFCLAYEHVCHFCIIVLVLY